MNNKLHMAISRYAKVIFNISINDVIALNMENTLTHTHKCTCRGYYVVSFQSFSLRSTQIELHYKTEKMYRFIYQMKECIVNLIV